MALFRSSREGGNLDRGQDYGWRKNDNVQLTTPPIARTTSKGLGELHLGIFNLTVVPSRFEVPSFAGTTFYPQTRNAIALDSWVGFVSHDFEA